MPQPAFILPPPRATIAIARQPDYRKWNSIRLGMSRAKVTSLLGSPLTGREQRPHTLLDPNFPAYGFISYPALPHKWTMLFTLGFDHHDRVCYKTDPFGGVPLSRTGKPSKPKCISPLPGTSFSHYPRLLDIRWFPCSGDYPILYELELGHAIPGSSQFFTDIYPQHYGQPYAVLSHPGAQPGQIRVRGRNAKGVSPWSEPLHFTFGV